MENKNSDNGNLVAIISHFSIVGWVIAVVLNSNNKTEHGSFYIRQTLGINILALLFYIPLLGYVFLIAVLVLWVLSLIGAVTGEKRELPVVGPYFQDWFQSL